MWPSSNSASTVEPLYNEVLGTMKITLLYQVSHYIRVKKQRNIKSWDQQNYLVIRGFCYIRPRYNEVPLYMKRYHNKETPHNRHLIVFNLWPCTFFILKFQTLPKLNSHKSVKNVPIWKLHKKSISVCFLMFWPFLHPQWLWLLHSWLTVFVFHQLQ